MEADTFSSGQEFVDLTEAMPSFRPDCVVLDVQMPGLTGLDVQAFLTQNSIELPIVFITAHDEVGVRERAMAAGALAFLRKPFNDELFIKTLRIAMESGARGKAAGDS
jgi:FixJ family two-component response regulator